MSSRKVTYVRLHTAMHVPGLCQLEAVFPATTKILNDLDMNTVEGGLSIKFSFTGKKVELLVPSGNIIGMVLSPEEDQSKPKDRLWGGK